MNQLPLNDMIKIRRNELKLSTRELAAKCGISQGYISQLEKGIDIRTGKQIRPTVDIMYKLAKGLNMPLNYLLGQPTEAEKIAQNITDLNTIKESSSGYNHVILPKIKNDLSPDEIIHIKKYRALDERGKTAVNETLEREYSYVKPKTEDSAM